MFFKPSYNTRTVKKLIKTMDIEKFNYINSLICAESNISFTLKDELHLVYNTQIAGQLMFVNKKNRGPL